MPRIVRRHSSSIDKSYLSVVRTFTFVKRPYHYKHLLLVEQPPVRNSKIIRLATFNIVPYCKV